MISIRQIKEGQYILDRLEDIEPGSGGITGDIDTLSQDELDAIIDVLGTPRSSDGIITLGTAEKNRILAALTA